MREEIQTGGRKRTEEMKRMSEKDTEDRRETRPNWRRENRRRERGKGEEGE